MYSFDSRVRYSEVDEDRKLSLTGVINYMQDCSTFQSEDLNMGIDYLTEKHRAWLLSSWHCGPLSETGRTHCGEYLAL